VLAETDVGLGRVGVSPGAELLDLARGIERLAGLSFEGIAFYPGHIKDNGEQGREALAALGGLIQSILADFRREGIEVRIVSGGSTPSLYHSHELPGLNEIRPGHIRLQRLEHGGERRLHAGRVRGRAAGDGGFDRAARPDHRRRRLQDVFVGPLDGIRPNPPSAMWWKRPRRCSIR
jgi:hypothetical protein